MRKPIRPYLADISRAIERIEMLTDGRLWPTIPPTGS